MRGMWTDRRMLASEPGGAHMVEAFFEVEECEYPSHPDMHSNGTYLAYNLLHICNDGKEINRDTALAILGAETVEYMETEAGKTQ